MNRLGVLGHAKSLCVAATLLAIGIPAYAQRVDVTPLFGGRWGGTVKVERDDGSSRGSASVLDSAVFGIAAGFRFDGPEGCEGCDVIEFRWMRQNTDLAPQGNPAPMLVATAASSFPRVGVSFDHFLGDFTHEFPIEYEKVRPFLTVSLGAARMSAPAGSGTGFIFGFGTGLKIFPHHHFGVRLGAEYLGTVRDVSAQVLACGGGGCFVSLSGGLINQFQATIGPEFRFGRK